MTQHDLAEDQRGDKGHVGCPLAPRATVGLSYTRLGQKPPQQRFKMSQPVPTFDGFISRSLLISLTTCEAFRTRPSISWVSFSRCESRLHASRGGSFSSHWGLLGRCGVTRLRWTGERGVYTSLCVRVTV